MAKEIERKFLVKGDAWRALARGTTYRQGYLNSAKERMPTSAPRRRSMIVTDSKLTGGLPKRGPPIEERRVIRVCRNVSFADTKSKA
jgi:hypothetical protein